MTSLMLAEWVALIGFVLGLAGIFLRAADMRRRSVPADVSPLKGQPAFGIVYAFTLGMMPWAKESTRIHAIAYLRGVGFHGGIFLATAAILASRFWYLLPDLARIPMVALLVFCALLGASGGLLRLLDPNLRGLSLPDDHFAVWIVTLYVGMTAAALLDPALLVPLYFLTALVWIYVPLGKIRHCLYFFFAKLFFGKFFGRRAVLPPRHPNMQAEVRP
jgi:hypothetical protein